MLLMVEKSIRRGICQTIYQYTKGNNKYMRDYDKIKQSSYLKYWDVNNLYGWAMSQKLPLGNLKSVGETSEFNKDFIKSYNDEIDDGCFLKDLHNFLKIYIIFTMIYSFFLKQCKLKKLKKLKNLQESLYLIEKLG